MDPGAVSITDLISSGGTIALLAWIVMGAIREWWFTGPAYRRLEMEKDQWKEMALRSLATADKAVTLAESPPQA